VCAIRAKGPGVVPTSRGREQAHELLALGQTPNQNIRAKDER
jgi:hypothetical protein